MAPNRHRPVGSSSSTCSSDTDEDLNVTLKKTTMGRKKNKRTDRTEAPSEDKKTDSPLRDIPPVENEMDRGVRFSSVGGLEEHIKSLREMVLFPLMYPDFFAKFNTRPARGVLFHGPPGTGKTLLARALAYECSQVGGRKVTFFMRKGADCLNMWLGGSERLLKQLFQAANTMKPSIIFFDEIDALAPVRNERQHEARNSVVGTLLAEMDGICDRGEVIIIGATNRLDAIDPALRRPGRFDRELLFELPHAAARRDILNIYTEHWRPRPPDDTIQHLAQITSGYGGSDLKALCSEAVLKALRRVYPQVYESEYALLIDANKVEVTREDLLEAMRSLVCAGARTNPLPARRLPEHAEPLLRGQLQAAEDLLRTVFTLDTRVGDTLSPSVLLITGECADTHIAPALLAQLEASERCTVKELSMSTLHSVQAFSQEQALITGFTECRRGVGGCVLWVRAVDCVWAALGARAPLLVQLWRAAAAGDNTLLLATTTKPHAQLPKELQELFPLYRDCVYSMREPSASEVIAFLKPIITEAPLKPPVIENHKPPPPLPRARDVSMDNPGEGTSRMPGAERDSVACKRCRMNACSWPGELIVKRRKTQETPFKESILHITDEDVIGLFSLDKETKPITSSSVMCDSDDDALLRRPRGVEMDGNPTVLLIPAKPTDKVSAAEQSPEKRNSGHEASSKGDAEAKVLINKTDLDNILYKNAKSLSQIGLQALLELHSQLTSAVRRYATQTDRTKLPQDMQKVVARYVQIAKK